MYKYKRLKYSSNMQDIVNNHTHSIKPVMHTAPKRCNYRQSTSS